MPQWTDVDFSPGIWTAPGFGFAGGLSAPPGAAQVADTYRCVPGPGGKGLAPGPGFTLASSFTVANLAEASAISSTGFTINGFHSFRTASQRGSADYIGILYNVSTPTNTRWKLLSVIQQGSAGYLVATLSGTAGFLENYTGASLTPTRMNPTTPYLTPGAPVMGYAMASATGVTTFNEQGVTPNPTAPGNNKLTFALGTYGCLILGHQNRYVVLENTFDTVNAGGIAALAQQGEAISFTDPANSNVIPATPQRQVFYPENPSGYGAWGSLSASALLLIKRYGGAILVEGDIAAPKITYLPGVQSTGRLCSEAGLTSLGLVYGVDKGGAWVWTGGSQSKKLSMQLDDYFYRNGSAAGAIYEASGYGVFAGPTFQALQWRDYIMISGNWMHHVPTKGWWRLDDISSKDHLFYRENFLPNILMASVVKTSGVTATQNYLDMYDSTIPATSYSWHSHPIKLTNDTDVMLTEIVLEAQRDTSGTGTSTITLTVYNADGTTLALPAWTVTASARPERIRIPVMSLGNFAEVKVVAANSSTAPAPIVTSMALGWMPSNLAPAA